MAKEESGSKRSLEARLLARAWKDQQFRQRLIDDPKAAIADELQVEIPGDVEVRVVQDTPQVVHLVLPVMSGKRQKELTDEELGTAGLRIERTSPEGIDCPYYLCATCRGRWEV